MASTDPKVSPWIPTTNLVEIAVIGKLIEELSEATGAAARCLIQGFTENEPVTGKPNSEWLLEELADAKAVIEKAIRYYNLDTAAIDVRVSKKLRHFEEWHQMIRACMSK